MGTVKNPATALADGVFSVYDGSGVAREVDRREIWLPASSFTSLTGSAALTAATSLLPGWDMDTTTDENLITGIMLPDSWTAMNASIYWGNASTGAGTVRWDITYASTALAAAPGAGTTASATSAAAPTTAFQIVATDVVSAGTVTPGNLSYIKVNRDADHAGDTVANDVRMYGVLLTRVFA